MQRSAVIHRYEKAIDEVKLGLANPALELIRSIRQGLLELPAEAAESSWLGRSIQSMV